MKCMRGQIVFSVIMSFILFHQCVFSQQSLDEYVNGRIKEIMTARINQNSVSIQKGTPSSSSNATSLVDRTSVSDLFGFGFNLAQFSQGLPDSLRSSSISVTTTAYALYAASVNNDPLDPVFYNSYASLRNLSFTYGNDALEDSLKRNLQVYNVKYLFWNGRDASSDGNKEPLKKITDQLTTASSAYGRLIKKIQNYLFEQSGKSADIITFMNKNFISPGWETYVKQLSNEEKTKIDGLIEDEIATFEMLNQDVLDAIDKIQNAPQASFSVGIKKLGQSTKQINLNLNFEYGVNQSLQFVANLAYQEERLGNGNTTAGGKAGFDLQYIPSRSNPFQKTEPMTFSLSAAANWSDLMKPSYQYQIMIEIPAANGLTLPLALRWTTKSLLDNNDFTAQLGFAIDLAKLISLKRNL
jgi:hypothetical protein